MTAFAICLDAASQRFACGTEQNVLSALAAVDQRRVRAGCQGGGCGVCKIRVCEGQYATRRMSRAHISEREEMQRVALACRTYPLSDLRIEPWGDPATRLARRLGFMPPPAAGDAPAAENKDG